MKRRYTLSPWALDYLGAARQAASCGFP
jgi:hypothetical protein